MNVLINNPKDINLMVFSTNDKTHLPLWRNGIAIRCSAMLGFLEYQYILKKYSWHFFPISLIVSDQFHLCHSKDKTIETSICYANGHFPELVPTSDKTTHPNRKLVDQISIVLGDVI